MTALPHEPQPLTFGDLYPGAVALAKRLRLRRLHILAGDGRPIATIEDRGPYYRIDHPSWKAGEASANVALLDFARVHLAGRRS